MKERKVWELVPKDPKIKIIGCRWVYTVKHDENGNIARYKARLVAQGFRQTKGIHYDEVFSPVVNFSVIRMCFSLFVCKFNWSHCQLDIKCAYLYATLNETVFMSQPPGFEDHVKNEHVCKLNRAIYGLHQSSRAWYFEIHSVFENLNFIKLEWTNCVYTYGDKAVILLYVDDIVIFGKNDSIISSICSKLKNHFDLKVLGKTRKLLGVEFEQDGKNLYIHQMSYIDKICETYKHFHIPHSSLPLAVGSVLSKSQCPNSDEEVFTMSKLPYRNILGCLAFISGRTRPDICYAINILSQFQSNPGIVHWNILLKLLGYVMCTQNYKLNISKVDDLNIKCYSDADFAANRDDRISMGGLILFVGEAPVLWRTFKQNCVSLSTLESEYVSLTEAVKELVWVIRIFKEFNKVKVLNINFDAHLYCDNQAAINFSKSTIENHRTKHIDVKFHFIRGLVLENLFSLEYVNTKLNLADIFTKPLPKVGLKGVVQKIFKV